jgi:hypothetical protein
MTDAPRTTRIGASRGETYGTGAALALAVLGGGGLLYVVLSARAGIVVAAGALLFVAGLALVTRPAVRTAADWWIERRRAPGEAGPAPLLAFAGLAAVVAAAALIGWLLFQTGG